MRVFSELDYSQAGVRQIAELADVDPALVGRYFGSKEGLYEVALETAIGVPEEDVDVAAFGREAVERLIGREGKGAEPLPIFLHGVSDPNAQPIALKQLTQSVAALGRWFGPPDGETRAAEAFALFIGFFVLRRLLPLPPYTGAMDPSVRTWLVDSLQLIAEGSERHRSSRESA